jgi:hypothetical protein
MQTAGFRVQRDPRGGWSWVSVLGHSRPYADHPNRGRPHGLTWISPLRCSSAPAPHFLSDAEFIQFSLFEKINAFQSRETEQKGLIAKLSPAYLHGWCRRSRFSDGWPCLGDLLGYGRVAGKGIGVADSVGMDGVPPRWTICSESAVGLLEADRAAPVRVGVHAASARVVYCFTSSAHRNPRTHQAIMRCLCCVQRRDSCTHA